MKTIDSGEQGTRWQAAAARVSGRLVQHLQPGHVRREGVLGGDQPAPGGHPGRGHRADQVQRADARAERDVAHVELRRAMRAARPRHEVPHHAQLLSRQS